MHAAAPAAVRREHGEDQQGAADRQVSRGKRESQAGTRRRQGRKPAKTTSQGTGATAPSLSAGRTRFEFRTPR